MFVVWKVSPPLPQKSGCEIRCVCACGSCLCLSLCGGMRFVLAAKLLRIATRYGKNRKSAGAGHCKNKNTNKLFISAEKVPEQRIYYTDSLARVAKEAESKRDSHTTETMNQK